MNRNEFEKTIDKMIAESAANALFLEEYRAYVSSMVWLSEPASALFQTFDDDYEESGISLTDINDFQKLLEEIKKRETFSDRLLSIIRKKKITAPDVYRAAGIDSRHFSKINSRRDYRPTKETVCAFAIALHLTVTETEDLLQRAGFAFSPSSIFDVTVRFFLEKEFYDRSRIDEIMENLGIPLLPQNF